MKPPCRYFRRCSGCTLLQMPYAKQVRDKTLALQDLVVAARLENAVPPVDVRPLIPSPVPLGYRSSTKLCLNENSFGLRAIGLYERGSKTVVDIPECPVHHPRLNAIVRQWFGPDATVPVPAPFYDHTRRGFQPGKLKFATVRVDPGARQGKGQVGVVLSHTGVEPAALEEWARRLDTKNVSLHACLITPGDSDYVLTEATTHLAGPKEFGCQIAGMALRLHPLSFFQANALLTDAFVAKVIAGLGGETLLDLYGGFGAYSLAAAASFKQVWVVDGNRAAIADARANAIELGHEHVHTKALTVEDFVTTPRHGLNRSVERHVTHVIVNPPRAGLSPTVRAFLGSERLPSLQHLVYVSCNPETLGRDLRSLASGRGRFRVEEIQGFDMFPQTKHVEVVAKLARCL